MDANKTYGEKAWRQLHKNAASNIEYFTEAAATTQQLYGHQPPITKTIKVRQAKHVGHCWRSRDELIRDVLLWTTSHGWAKARPPARIYIQQLCADTECNLNDLPEAMDDRKGVRERERDRERERQRVRDIRADCVMMMMMMMMASSNYS